MAGEQDSHKESAAELRQEARKLIERMTRTRGHDAKQALANRASELFRQAAVLQRQRKLREQ